VVVAGLTLTGVPLVTEIGPGVITPVPALKAAVSCEPDPELIVVGFAVKLVIVGTGSTVTVAVAVTTPPTVGVTVSV
jgi:hypothetical protein